MLQEFMLYKHHIFFCTNERPACDARGCCQAGGAQDLRAYMKACVRDQKLKNIRVTASGCLGQCALGPAVVIYPQGIWYRCATRADVDEIIESHLKNDVVVERLVLAVQNA